MSEITTYNLNEDGMISIAQELSCTAEYLSTHTYPVCTRFKTNHNDYFYEKLLLCVEILEFLINISLEEMKNKIFKL